MAKLVCPYCGAFTAFSPAQIIGKGVLLGYSSEKETTWGEVQISAVVPYEYAYGEDTYAILVCRACDELFVAKKEKYSSKESPVWSAVYPIPHRPVAKEIPEPIKSEFEEAHLCLAVEAYKACVLMCQITLEHIWHEQHVSGLTQLEEKDIIRSGLCRRANEIRLWGNLEKHQLITDPISPDDAKQLLGYVELILNEVYVEPHQLDSLTKKRKELEKKD